MSRIGEVVMNSFIDAYEHQVLKKINDADDEVPAFHEWATVQPGMICLARKKRTAQYRQFHAAGEQLPSPSPVRVFCTYTTFPTLPCRNRDARHRLRRVPHAGRRAQLFLRRRVPIEDGSRARYAALPPSSSNFCRSRRLTDSPPRAQTTASARRSTSFSRCRSAAW